MVGYSLFYSIPDSCVLTFDRLPFFTMSNERGKENERNHASLGFLEGGPVEVSGQRGTCGISVIVSCEPALPL